MSDKLDLGRLDWRALFGRMHPGFFEQENIRRLPAERVWEEQALDPRAFSPEALAVPVPEGTSFGFYDGSLDALRDEVRKVDAFWPELFDGSHRVYCAWVHGRLASFCLVENMGTFDGLHVGGPGCVGTLPEFRRRGVGLKMVQNATAILRDEGYDISYIHFTGVGPWYARLGYRTVLRWTRDGFVD